MLWCVEMCKNSIWKGKNCETGEIEGTTGKKNIRSNPASGSRVMVEEADDIKIKKENEIE